MLMLERTPLEETAGLWYDLYKDVNGIRPRVDTTGWTLEDYERRIASLSLQLEANLKEKKRDEAAAAVEFEATIVKLIGMGAADRAAAIRWISDGEEAGDDMEYLAYKLGLPYGYFSRTS